MESRSGAPLFPTGIRRRLLVASLCLVTIVGVASAAALATSREVNGLLADVAASEDGIEAVLRLSAAVRDQYAHQAHTIILNDRTHLHHYEHAQHDVASALAASRSHAGDAEDLRILDEIAGVAEEMNENFQQRILPLVPGDREAVFPAHDRALELVTRSVELSDALSRRYSDRVDVARARADAGRAAAVPRSVALIVFALVVALGVGVYVDRSLAGPLRSLESGARRLATGELSARIPIDRDDELGSLARTFNEMAAQLEARQAELLRAERLAGVGKLAAGVAHEINNPLGVILGYAKLIARGKDEASAADAGVILEEVGRCQEIVAGLLDLARPPRLVAAPVFLGELVREVAGRLHDGDERKVGVEAEPDMQVEADASKLRQIVWNLLRNAEEARPGGAVQVAVRQRGEQVVLSVRDHGPGLSHEARQRLFEPFFTTKPKGTGLGLPVCAALARAHGGDLVAPDTGGDGALFELLLPARAAQLPEVG